VVNGSPQPDFVFLSRHKVWIPWQDLVNAGLRNLGGDREIIAGVEHVSLRSLAPDITFERDDAALILRLQTPAAALETGVVNFNPSNAPSGILYSQPLSAYLNYGVNWQDFETLEVGGELVISFGGNAFASGWFIDANNGFQRGLTNMVFDNPKHLTSLVIGDTFVNTDTLGGVAYWGGLAGGAILS
jgi:outer membrane usher protein FimD/PapC